MVRPPEELGLSLHKADDPTSGGKVGCTKAQVFRVFATYRGSRSTVPKENGGKKKEGALDLATSENARSLHREPPPLPSFRRNGPASGVQVPN